MNKRTATFGIIAFWGILLFAGCRSKNNNGTGNNRMKADSLLSDSLFHTKRLKSLSDSIRQFPDTSRLYFERGGLLFVMKEYELAGKDLQKAIALDPLKAAYYLALGEIYFTQNQADSAVKAYKKTLNLDPASLRARLQLAYIFLLQEQYPKVILETDTLLKRDPKLAEAYGLRSQAFRALGNPDKALQVMKKAVTLSPQNYQALMALGDLLMDQNSEEALTYYQKAKEADTTNAEPLYCIGLFYKKSAQRDKAISAFKSCIERDPYYEKAYLELGKLYEKENNWKKAAETFNLAIKTNPVSSDAYYHRGVCNEKMDKLKAALSDYEQALVLDDKNQEAEHAINRLRKQNP